LRILKMTTNQSVPVCLAKCLLQPATNNNLLYNMKMHWAENPGTVRGQAFDGIRPALPTGFVPDFDSFAIVGDEVGLCKIIQQSQSC
jgi:hypothetical protein